MVPLLLMFLAGLLCGGCVVLAWRAGDVAALRDCVEWQHGQNETLKLHLREAQQRLQQHRAAANYRLSAEDLARRFNERNPTSHAKTDQVKQPPGSFDSRAAEQIAGMFEAAAGRPLGVHKPEFTWTKESGWRWRCKDRLCPVCLDKSEEAIRRMFRGAL